MTVVHAGFIPLEILLRPIWTAIYSPKAIQATRIVLHRSREPTVTSFLIAGW